MSADNKAVSKTITFNGRSAELTVYPVTAENVHTAIDIAATGFPGELPEVVRSFMSSLEADHSKWTLSGAEDMLNLKYIMLYVDGKPVGVTGLYSLRVNPGEAWYGWVALDPRYRGYGLGDQIIDSVETLARQEGYETLRAWSVDIPRFDAMHRKFRQQGYVEERVRGHQHGLGGYLVFSRNLNGGRPTPYPVEAVMAGGSEDVLPETSLLNEILETLRNHVGHQKKTAKARAEFLKKHGSTENYILQGRLVDLTDRIGDLNDPLVQSFFAMNEELFPCEGERETPEGLVQYMQPDHTGTFPPNERRILAVLSEDRTKVIAAGIYGVTATSDEMAKETGIDGVVGITYVMVDAGYRGVGLGGYFAKTLIKEKAQEFLRKKGRGDKPRVILGAEVNAVEQLSLREAVSDMSGALILPMQREKFWYGCGFRTLAFDNYAQLKLRTDGEPFEALNYAISGWHSDQEMPSDLAWHLIKSHAELCLNKQQGLDHGDQALLGKMKRTLCKKPLVQLRPVKDFHGQETQLLAALLQESVGGLGSSAREDALVGEILYDYSVTIRSNGQQPAKAPSVHDKARPRI